jgi:FACT complex subunit SPT16 N-terminal lobe domain
MQGGKDVWAGSTALAIAAGPATDELRYLKSITLQLYLFGYELPGECLLLITCCGQPVEGHLRNARKFAAVVPSAADTVLGFTRTALHVVTSGKKGARSSAA